MMLPSIAAARRCSGARSRALARHIGLPHAPTSVRIPREDKEDADREADGDVGWQR
jgi:hypothetical protein